MVDFITRFNDFRGGDYGLEDPSRAQDNQFSGRNLMVYDSDLLGVRAGVKEFEINGLPNHPSVEPAGFDVWGKNLVVVLDHPWRIPIPDDGSIPTALSMGEYATKAEGFVKFTEAEGNLYSTSNGVLYKHSKDTDSTVIVPTPVGVELEGITRWRYRLIGWDKNVPWRMYYSTVNSAGAQWDTWEDNNFLDIPGNEPIQVLVPWYNQLLVGKKSGWTQVSGVITERPYVRTLTRGNGPLDQRSVAATTDNRALYWGTEPVPFWFNGENTYMDRHYRVAQFDTTYPLQTVIAAPTGRKLLMLAQDAEAAAEEKENTGLLMYRGSDWSAHQFQFPMAGIAPTDVRHGYSLPNHVIFGMAQPANIGDPVNIISWSHNMNRPGRHGDDWVSASDAPLHDSHITGSYLSPAWYDSQSRMVMVRAIVIQFRKWSCGDNVGLNELHVRVRPMGKYEEGAGISETQAWVERADLAGDDGTDDSWRVGVGLQGYANGFQIDIPKMRGVAIRSIEVHVVLGGKRL